MIRCPFNNCEECPNSGSCDLEEIPVFLTQAVEPIYNEIGLIVGIKSKENL